MPSAPANRFVYLSFDVDPGEWVGWAIAHDVMTEVIACVRLRHELRHKFDPSKNDKAFSTPPLGESADQTPGLRLAAPDSIRPELCEPTCISRPA
jgi:hypothetical protein